MRPKSPQSLLLVLLGCPALWAAPPVNLPGMAAPAPSSYSVELRMHLTRPLPPGVSLICRARLEAPGLAGYGWAEQHTTPAGSNANCVVPVPYTAIAGQPYRLSWQVEAGPTVLAAATETLTPQTAAMALRTLELR